MWRAQVIDSWKRRLVLAKKGAGQRRAKVNKKSNSSKHETNSFSRFTSRRGGDRLEALTSWFLRRKEARVCHSRLQDSHYPLTSAQAEEVGSGKASPRLSSVGKLSGRRLLTSLPNPPQASYFNLISLVTPAGRWQTTVSSSANVQREPCKAKRDVQSDLVKLRDSRPHHFRSAIGAFAAMLRQSCPRPDM